MKTEKKAEEIRKACIKANPEIVGECWRCEGKGYTQNSLVGTVVCNEEDCKDGIIERPIGIAEILFVIENDKHIYVSAYTGLFSVWSRTIGEMVSHHVSWNLKNDTLDWHTKNKLEVVDYLYDLLK